MSMFVYILLCLRENLPPIQDQELDSVPIAQFSTICMSSVSCANHTGKSSLSFPVSLIPPSSSESTFT